MDHTTRETTLLFALAAGLIVLVATGNGLLCLGAFGLIVMAVAGWQRGWWAGCGRVMARLGHGLLVLWRSWWVEKEVQPGRQLYDVKLGNDEATGKPIIENLESIKSLVFAGTSGFGKTTWAQQFVHDLVSTHRPNDIKLAIGDVKRVSYSPWRNIPHLFCPIAKTRDQHALLLKAVFQEMERRQSLFEEYEDSFCESLDDYQRLSGVRLPRLVVLIDELADAVQPGEVAYETMVTLAKMGRFVGIHLFLGTQRPSASVLTGEIMSQIVTLLFTYMPNSREFGVVAMVPKEVYQLATPTPGRFMLYTTRGQWRFMTVKRESRDLIARSAKRLSGRERGWEEETRISHNFAHVTEWDGDDDRKIAMLRAWAGTLEARPRVVDVMKRYGLSKPTAIKYHKLAFSEDR